MSKSEWEGGKVKLPSAEFARVRKAMQDETQRHFDEVFDHTQKFWKGLSAKAKRDPAVYRNAAHNYCYGDYNDPRSDGVRSRTRGDDSALADSLSHRLSQVLRTQRERTVTGFDGKPRTVTDRVDSPPRRVLKSEMGFPTNKTTAFSASSEDGYVTFDRDSSTVTWSVADNNYAVGKAHSGPMWRRLSTELDRVKWTRGTGGVFTGNDEYNEDTEEAGGGANYVTDAFGPIGAEREPFTCREFVDSKGVRHTRNSMMTEAVVEAKRRERRQRREAKARQSGGPQGRVQRGVPSGGQFGSRYHGESGRSL